jgi:phage replication O-like protein O
VLTIDENKSANPQAEDGHLDIANELAEAFFNLQLSGNQWRILWVIFRQTYGWHKKTDRISVSQFERKTGLKRRHVVRALNDMVERKIITKNDTTFISTYGFQKDYLKWKPLPKKTPITKNDTKTITISGNHKRNSKENTTCRSQKPIDSGVKSVLVYWGEIFLQETGEPYAFSFGKDGKIIKDLLRVHSPELLQEMIRAFFRDERCKQRGLDIGIFRQEINRLVGLRAMDPLEQARREAGFKK